MISDAWLYLFYTYFNAVILQHIALFHGICITDY